MSLFEAEVCPLGWNQVELGELHLLLSVLFGGLFSRDPPLRSY